MSEMITPEREFLRRRAFNMSCDDQHWLAIQIASNLGYVLTPGDQPEPGGVIERLERLEAAVRELNPGLRI
jgi:hypothetical protein